ncbi:DUF2094 domain-containing protein [Mycobacterium sp. KBS0706]|nr:DUF2094 domain-containing protein [Mycobacterium sp. KBS0706]
MRLGRGRRRLGGIVLRCAAVAHILPAGASRRFALIGVLTPSGDVVGRCFPLRLRPGPVRISRQQGDETHPASVLFNHFVLER